MIVNVEHNGPTDNWTASCNCPIIAVTGATEVIALGRLNNRLMAMHHGLLPGHVFCNNCGASGDVMIEEGGKLVPITCPECDGEGQTFNQQKDQIPF